MPLKSPFWKGISSFRAFSLASHVVERKSAAQKKLEDEKQNLLRVSDILSELEKQVEPLEKQSEKARIYLKKKEQLKDLDVNVFLLENARLKDQLAGGCEKRFKSAEYR